MFSISRDAAPSLFAMEPVVLAVDRTRRHALASRRSVLEDPALAGHLIPAGGRLSAGPRTATGLGPLDALLDGGFPRGQLVELVGPRTSGRTRVLLGTLAGVFILAMLDNTFNQLEVDAFLKDVARGVIIIAAVAAYSVRWTRRRREEAQAEIGQTPGPEPAVGGAAP